MSIEELYKILMSDKPSEIIKEHEEEVFELIPELKKCKGFDQNSEWHIYDVYEHILHVIDKVPKNLSLRLAALFHDVGKPLTYTVDENNVGHFYGHWEESQRIFDAFANKHNLDKNFSNFVSNLIFFHDKNVSKMTNEEQTELVNIFGDDGITMLFQLKEADLLSQNKKFEYLKDDYQIQLKRLLKLIQ